MLLLNTCVGDIEASPQPSPWERAYRYSCLLISYKTNLAPSPTERAGERLFPRRGLGRGFSYGEGRGEALKQYLQQLVRNLYDPFRIAYLEIPARIPIKSDQERVDAHVFYLFFIIGYQRVIDSGLIVDFPLGEMAVTPVEQKVSSCYPADFLNCPTYHVGITLVNDSFFKFFLHMILLKVPLCKVSFAYILNHFSPV